MTAIQHQIAQAKANLTMYELRLSALNSESAALKLEGVEGANNARRHHMKRVTRISEIEARNG